MLTLGFLHSSNKVVFVPFAMMLTQQIMYILSFSRSDVQLSMPTQPDVAPCSFHGVREGTPLTDAFDAFVVFGGQGENV